MILEIFENRLERDDAATIPEAARILCVASAMSADIKQAVCCAKDFLQCRAQDQAVANG
jgi:hypothetical protein